MDEINYKYESEKYKLTLANDLIVFLSVVIIANMNKAQASETLGTIMQKWTERVDKHLATINADNRAYIAANLGEEELDDVIDIMVDIHTSLPRILRDEFISETLEIIQKQVIDRVKL